MSKAYTVLSDKDKRYQYDQFGEDGLRTSASSYDDHAEMSPDELFRMFFGNSFGDGQLVNS